MVNYITTQNILLGTGLLSATGNSLYINGSGLSTELMYACSDESTAITATTGKLQFRMPFGMRLNTIRVSMNVAPSGSSFLLDLNQTGASVLATRCSVDSTQTTSLSAGTPVVVSGVMANLLNDAQMSVDFDQIGAVTAGAGVKLTMYGIRTI